MLSSGQTVIAGNAFNLVIPWLLKCGISWTLT